MAIGKITIKERSDILIWGHRIKGMFTIGEGYQLKAEHNRHPEINKWESIWKVKTWPKIAFFIWIKAHRYVCFVENKKRQWSTLPILAISVITVETTPSNF